ncbi:DUF4352 domain-containing protein [Kineococcus sp. SYSU DK001]|uniref:hypothetical protein n=1 Tax=Kineococcus sp. SYSU DK001 TaxID=3383122 RepID=UPI003D7E2533
MSQFVAPPPPQAVPRRGKGLAVAALVIGIVAAAGCLVPVLNIGSIVLAVVGLVLGVVALVRRADGKGMSVAGVVLSLVAIVVAIVVNVAAGAALTAVDEAVDQAATDAANGYSTVDPQDAEQAAAAAVALGTPARVGDYTVTVTAVNQDATQVIAEANPFNEAAQGRYVLVDLTATYDGQAPEANPWIDLTTGFQGTDARNYSTTSCTATLPNSAFDQPGLRAGGTASYQVCFDVPAEAIAGGLVSVEQFADFQDDQVVWALG